MSVLKEPRHAVALIIGSFLSVALFGRTSTLSMAGVPLVFGLVSAAVSLARGKDLHDSSREGGTTFLVVFVGSAALLFIVVGVQINI
jgi:hypothetical protein